MSRANRSAVTLIEMLVVVAILALLMAILLPAALGAREAGRRNRCINNLKEIASAVNHFEAAKQRFPGYLNGTQALHTPQQPRGAVSWVIVLLPYLERADLWNQWMNWRAADPYPVPDPTLPLPGPVIGQLICPSDGREVHVGPLFTPLSYVANCGLPDTLAQGSPPIVDTPASAVFVNAYPAVVPSRAMKASDLKDGASLTLMLSENLQATEWFPTVKPPPPAGLPAARVATEADVGMVWWPAGRVPSSNVWINQGRKDPVGAPPPIEYARPSSNHPGGVVAAYCDGRAEFIDETIDHRVFQSMMAPHDVSVSGMFVPP
jgi:prepilin-type N-terminal cleavage/methylation domain-containing protein